MAESSNFELGDDKIIIFKNNFKNKPGHPDLVGKINVNGEIREIVLWVKTGRKGEYWSGQHNPPYSPDSQPSAPQTPRQKAEDDFDPF